MYVQNLYGAGTSIRARLHDHVMLPNNAHLPELEISVSQSPTGGLIIAEFFNFMEVGARLGMNEHTLSAEQLGDLYEVMHHRLHGSDVRGLDPRQGATRLTAGLLPAGRGF